jgi:hypothetical protein
MNATPHVRVVTSIPEVCPSVSIGHAKHILKAAEDVLVVADSSANVVYRITPSQVPRLDVREVADRIVSVARPKTTGEKGAVVTDAQWAQLH